MTRVANGKKSVCRKIVLKNNKEDRLEATVFSVSTLMVEIFYEYLEIFEVAAMIGKIEKFFDHEVLSEDCWALPADYYELLSPEERQVKWFTINPDKLNSATKMSNDVLLLSEQQKESLLAAFQTLKITQKIFRRVLTLKKEC